MKLFCFWTGTNPMSEQRLACCLTLPNTGLTVTLITPQNLTEYLVEGHPLHAGYQYLSETHKADYLRTYFMHFHGGAYSDIKFTNESWVPSAKEIHSDKNIWMIGYKEVGPHGVPVIVGDPSLNALLHQEWFKLIGNGAYICRPKTPLTSAWYSSMMSVMEAKLPQLEKYAARSPQEVFSAQYPYPLRWAELLGEVFHPICHAFSAHVRQTLPPPRFTQYR